MPEYNISRKNAVKKLKHVYSGRHHGLKIKLCMEFLLTISLALFAKYDVFARPSFSENYCGDDPVKKKKKKTINKFHGDLNF